MRNVIQDGYTRAAIIKAVPGLYEGLTITYRPMLPEQVDAVMFAVDKKRRGEQFAAARLIEAGAIARQLESWNECESDGTPVKIVPATITRMPPKLLRRLFDVVSGWEPGDLPEAATAEEKDAYLAEITGDDAGN